MTLTLMVTGSRDWPYPATIHEQIDIALQEAGNQPLTLIHGDCPTGADRIASLYATKIDLPQIKYPADWSLYGRAAGPIRNISMIDSKPNLVLAFQWNNSKGTHHAISLAQKHAIPIRIFNLESKENHVK